MNWTDNACYYVSIIDGDKKALIAGPLKTHTEALNLVDKARIAGREVDPGSHWYAWGTAKAPHGYHKGCLNKALNI